MKARLGDTSHPSLPDLRRGLDAARDLDVCDILVSAEILAQPTSSKNVTISCPYGEQLHSNCDRNPSCSVSTETGAWHCFGCENRGNLRQLLEAYEVPEAQIHVHLGEGKKPDSPEKPVYRTVEEYARAKKLPEKFLRDLGLEDEVLFEEPTIRIPYRDEHGQELFSRRRPGPNGKRFYQPAGQETVLYGLDRLTEAQKAGYVILVEGESDAQTLWHQKYPAIGLPGKAWKPAYTAALDGIENIYFVREPDNHDLTAITHELGDRLRVIELPRAEDVSDLYVQQPLAFRERFEDAKAIADSQAAGQGSKGQMVNLSAHANSGHLGTSLSESLQPYSEGKAATWEWFFKYQGHPYLARNSFHMLIGEEFSGKSLLAMWIAAQVTSGTWGAPGNVLYLAAEDDWSRTLIPRAQAVGADMDRLIHHDPDRHSLAFPSGLAGLQPILIDKNIDLVLIDCVIDYVDAQLNIDAKQDAQKLAGAFRTICSTTNATVIGLGHTNRGGGVDARSRTGGSLRLRQAARMATLWGKHPDSDSRRVWIPAGSNISADSPALEFELVAPTTLTGAPFLRLVGETDVSTAEILSKDDEEEKLAVEEFEDFIISYLGDQQTHDGRDMEKAALKECGHSTKTYDRARRRLRRDGRIDFKKLPGNKTEWYLKDVGEPSETLSNGRPVDEEQ
jgi:hypothetical protein